MLFVFIPFLSPHFSWSILSLFPVLDTYMWVVIIDYLFLFSFPLHTFSFLVTCNPPANVSSAHPCPVFVVYHYRVSPMYVHCHHHIVLTSFFFIMPCLTPFLCLLMIILLFFFSSCLVFLSCVFFYVLVHPNFSGVRRNFTAVYLYYSVGQIFCTCPLCPFPTAFCRFSL